MNLASVEYNVVGSFPPFTFSVKDINGIERYISNDGSKIFFDAVLEGIYKITISKAGCVIKNEVSVIKNITPISSCQAPLISLESIVDLTATFNISNTLGCLGNELQYSLTEDFSSLSSKFSTCSSTANIVFTTAELFYVRLIKSCDGITKTSNVVTVNLKSNNCYINASCQGVGNDPDYDTYRITLNEITTENVQFTLSNGSIVNINQGESFGEAIMNVVSGCPVIVSNSLNLKYCGV